MNQRIPPVATLPITINQESTIGRMLFDQEKITISEIERILRLQRQQGIRFGEAGQILGLITETDVKQVLAKQFGFPYLHPGEGAFPQELIAAYEPFSDEAEMLRDIRGQLLQRWFGNAHSALTIVSISPEEGASVFIANLGVVFAQLGEPTLIIDANMRKPQQHEIFQLRGRLGLSEILADRCGMQAVCGVDYFDDLSVLPAGTVPPNPQELLLRPSFRELQKNLCRHFKIILIDVPALSSGADALAVAASVGGVVLLARRDGTYLADLSTVKEKMRRAGVEVVGSVLLDF